MIVALDGPAASGKGTIALGLAKYFNFDHIDSGLLYRFYPDVSILLEKIPTRKKVETFMSSLNDANFDNLRNENHAQTAAKFAQLPQVRSLVNEVIRKMCHEASKKFDGIVVDGRDIGTVVFPDADVKLFVTAPAKVRAHRRYEEMLSRGLDVDFDNILADIRARDDRDAGRATAPLKPAVDAILLDTGDLTIGAAVQAAIAAVEARLRAV